MKTYLVGSTYFFKELKDFKSKDKDIVILVEKPKGFKNVRQTSGSFCLFEWRKMSADEFVEFTLKTNTPMSIGKFLNKEFCDDIGFTIEHLKKLSPVVQMLDSKHLYEKIIYDFYISNNAYYLTNEQLLVAFKEYKAERK